jgi:uncharacterized cupredoxin-like copper-binding protein
LKNGGSNDSGALLPGNYSVAETVPAAWDQTPAASCSDGATTYQPSAITLAAGKTVTCNFTNVQRGHIIVNKTTNPSPDPTDTSFAFATTGTGYSGFSLKNGGSNDSGALLPGNYSVAETVPAAWDQTPAASCSDGTTTYQPSAITLAAGKTVTCNFTNTGRGSINVVKNTVGGDGTFSFSSNFGLTSLTTSSGTANHQFDNLAAGNSYHVSETIPAGWDLTSSSCDHGTPSAVTVLPGQTTTCTFTNTRRGKAQVIKTLNGAPPFGSLSFTFQIRQGASSTAAGTILETKYATAANGGVINFVTWLVPAATYSLCETVMPGWMTTLGPPLFVVYNPSGDNSTVCTNFTVQPGQTRTFTIDNTTPPGGFARTIGFWKNWASCSNSNGKQKPILDQTLALAEPGGITVGILNLQGSTVTPNAAPSCPAAVAVLSKRTISTGKSMSSDPAFNMAAQLLGADLNVQAGAGACPALVTAINSAQSLLAAILFDGNTHLVMTSEQKTQANSLQTQLNSYNNNNFGFCQ